MRLVALWLGALLIVVPQQSFADKTIVTEARVGSKQLFTRFVLGVADLGQHKVFTLERPDRLVIDIAHAEWSVSSSQLASVAKNPMIKTVRHGRPKPGVLRVVVDLAAPILIKSDFVIKPGPKYPLHRIVVDFARDKTGISRSTEKTLPWQDIARTVLPTAKTPKPTLRPRPKQWAEKPVIVLDPGHGGIDPGAIGRTSRVNEKRITFQYAIALKNALEKTGKYKVVLTRKGDYYVNLRDRVRKAQLAKSDLFISLHADSHPNRNTRGLSVYTVSEKASDREAAALAKRANREDVITGVDLTIESKEVRDVLIDLVQRDTINQSADFAELLVRQLGDKVKLLRNTHRFAGFVVLTGADVPSVLIELGYLSNAREEKLLQTRAYREKLVASIARAVNTYFVEQRGRGV